MLTAGGRPESAVLTASDLGHFANLGADDFNNWLPQSDFEFDPQLFGGYRDTQDFLTFDDSFFNEAVDMDFLTPYNLPISSPAAPKKDLIAQIDEAKESDEPPAKAEPQFMKCNEVWYVQMAPYRFSYVTR